MTTVTIQPLLPTNNPVPTGITVTQNQNGSVDILLSWTYTQSATVPADGLMLFYKTGSTSTVTKSDASITLPAGATSYLFSGVAQDVTGRVGIAAYRKTAAGISIGPIQQPTSAPDWRVTGSTANFTGNIAGTGASTLVSTANTAASNASSALSGLTDKLNKSAADTLAATITLQTGGSILAGTTSNGVYMASTGLVGVKAGVTTFSVDSAGNAVFKGDITGASGTFSGSVSATSTSSANALIGQATGSGYGVYGYHTGTGSGTGVAGYANGNGYGVSAQNVSGNGAAIFINGPIAWGLTASCTSATHVANLNADLLDGYNASDFLLSGGTAYDSSRLGGTAASGWCQLFSTNSGTAYASGNGFGLTTGGSLSGGYRFTGSGNVITLTDVSDESLKQDITAEALGLDFINQLEPVSYRMIANPGMLHHGFIANRMDALFEAPNVDALYTEAEDGIKGMGYISLIGPLVKAVQELTKKVAELESKLEGQ
ncbi:MAG: tail fiber domain-containing protein [Methylobacter sp.]